MAPAVAAWIPTERVGDILGLRGAIVQRIKQLSGAAQVHIQEEAGCPTTPVQVAGTPEAVAKVHELVHAVLLGKHEAIGFVREELGMPEVLARLPANPLGNLLKRVSSATGAWVQHPDPGGPLVLTGLPQAVKHANAMLMQGGGEGALGGDGLGLAQTPASGMQQAGPSMSRPAFPGSIGSCMNDQWYQQFRSEASPYETATSMGASLGQVGAGLVGTSLLARMRPGYGSSNPNQVLTADFEIPAQRVKDVLGVKGRNVKALKQHSGIQKIGITDRSDPATVTVTGTQAAIETCRHMVLAIVGGDQSVIGNVVESMELDQRVVSKLIGPKGQVISQIKDQSGAYLEVRETGGGQPPKMIMTGPPDCVQKARELIAHFLGEGGSGQPGAPSSRNSAAEDAYAQYYAQAKLQEAQIHAQIREAQFQAQVQEAAQLQQQAQLLALASLQYQSQQSDGDGSGFPPAVDEQVQQAQQEAQMAQLQALALQQAAAAAAAAALPAGQPGDAYTDPYADPYADAYADAYAR